jgi:hypothetical protein
MTSGETNMQPMRALSVQEVEQVAGGALFGFIIGYGIGAGPGGFNVSGGLTVGGYVSRFEDWVNGK